MKTDEKLREGFRVGVSREERVIYITFFCNEELSDDNIRATELVIADAYRAIESCGVLACRALVDTVAIPKGVRIVVPKSRELYADLIADSRIVKVAFLGSNDFIASLIGTIGDLTGHPSKVKWFSDVDKAKAWLEE